MIFRYSLSVVAILFILSSIANAQTEKPTSSSAEVYETRTAIMVNEDLSSIPMELLVDGDSASSVVTLAIPVGNFMSLVHPKHRGQAQAYNWEFLIESIHANVHPGSWDVNGGSGQISSFQTNMCLVVTNELEISRDVVAYLKNLTESADALEKAGVKIRLPRQ